MADSTAKATTTEAVQSNASTFTSKLEKPAQRFLAHVIEHCFEIGRRSAADFIRHFSAIDVMTALERRPDLRADVLVPATGINHKVALRKSARSSGEDLQIALDEGVTAATEVVALFRPDDRVRYLDNRKLWTFVTEGEFWKTDKSKGAAFEKAKSHIAFMLDRGLADGLLDHSDLVAGVSVETLAQSLPREKLGEIINAALALGRDKKSFTDRDLLATAAASVLVEDVSLVHIWETVLVPKVAVAHGLVEGERSAAPSTPIAAADSRPVAVAATGPAPGMPAARTETRTADLGKAPARMAKKTKLGEPAKAGDKKPAKKAAASAAPAGLEELLVDVDDFEIEEIEEEFGDQLTAT